VDDRDNMRPGAKYFEWERKGVPLRIEVGPRDAAAGTCVVASRTGGEKQVVSFDDVKAHADAALEVMQQHLFDKALARQQANTFTVESYADMKRQLEDGPAGLFLVPWKADVANEEAIKEETKATIRCYPLDAQADLEGKKCFYSGDAATHMAIFARAF
jgi:prolyl-tRNA synthetase